MLLVLSSHADRAVASAVEHWRGAGARVEILTCHDLAQRGWRFGLDDEPTLVVGGKPIAAGNVDGVLVRLAGATPFEVPFVAEEDREYAAAEMHGFLVALLDRMPCPVVNRPTPGCLCGPAWAQEQWVRAAVDAELDVVEVSRRIYAGGDVPAATEGRDVRVAHVVHERCFGDVSDEARKAALALARAAGVELLRVHFEVAERPRFLHADFWIDVADREIAGAVRARFS
jgi:hypothetical protein